MLGWLLPLVAAAGTPAIRYDVVVIDGDADAIGLLDRAASCRPPALLGRDALPLAVAAVVGPSASLVAQPTLVAAIGERAEFVMRNGVAELSLDLTAEQLAPGMLQVALGVSTAPDAAHPTQRYTAPSGAQSVVILGERFVAVRATIVDDSDSGTWNDAEQTAALTKTLIGDGPARQRARNLERLLVTCGL
jgi:hypothetical protein